MSHRAWKAAGLVLLLGGFLEKTGVASCSNDVGKARADRMAMHCRRVNTGAQASCLSTDCSTLSSVVQAFCTAPKGRPALCSEYPALVVSKPSGIPPDLERIAATAAEDREAAGSGLAPMRETLTLVTSLAASVKSSKVTAVAEQQSFTQRSLAASATYKRYKAAVDSKSAAQLAEAPKLLEAARTDYSAAASIGDSLLKHTAEQREHERKLVASVRGADSVATSINLHALDASNALLIMAEALQSGAKASAAPADMARVTALRDQVLEASKDAAKSAKEATELARKAHQLAEMGPRYDEHEAEARASTQDEALKKKVDEVKRVLPGLTGTSGNVCDRPMLERAWKASARTRAAHGGGVPVVLHTIDAKTVAQACPFLKTTLGAAAGPAAPGAAGGSPNVDMGFVPFADLGLEILVLVESGLKCTAKGCGHTFFVNEGGGFTAAGSSIVTAELAGFARRGVDIFAMLAEGEWKLQRTPGKPPQLVFSRPR